jgi:hypothetical protein|tara:strand:- start:297 stop:458 length:162 start_codon:yes stop_codon:yes gene_type:complete
MNSDEKLLFEFFSELLEHKDHKKIIKVLFEEDDPETIIGRLIDKKDPNKKKSK